MPYKHIVFIKLFLDLFDGDDRFLYKLTERQQLLYIKLLYLAGRTHNKIPKNTPYLKSKMAFSSSDQDLTQDLHAIKRVFKRFKETKYFYIFTKFDKLHNRIDDGKIGSSQENPLERTKVK